MKSSTRSTKSSISERLERQQPGAGNTIVLLLVATAALGGCAGWRGNAEQSSAEPSSGERAVATRQKNNDETASVDTSSVRVTVEVSAAESVILDEELRENIERFLGIRALARQRSDSGVRAVTAARVRRAHQQAAGQIAEALAPYGYYESRVRSTLERDGDRFDARYRVDPGSPVVLGLVDVRVDGPAAELPEVARVLDSIPLTQGRRLRHERYSAAKQSLLDVVYDAGFLDAAYETAALRIDRDARTADVVLHLRSGQRYYFGEFDLQQSILRPGFANRFLSIEPGEPFNATRLVDLQLLLGDTDYFNAVEVSADRSGAIDQRVPVTISTTPGKSRRYNVGLGYGTNTGPRGRLGLELRRLNRRGHQFSADLQASAVRNTLAAEYRVPFKNVVEDRYRFFARLDQAEVGDADTDQFSIGAQREESWLGLRRQLYLKYDGENFTFGDQPSQQSRLLIAGMSLSYQRADDPLFARRGVSVNFDVHGAEASLASETTFVQSRLGANAVLPLGARSRLLLRGEAGITEADDFSRLPPGGRFFTGGDRSVRGYAFQTLSPENAAGDDIGGPRLTVVSAEVDYLLRGNLGLALFVDHGGASNRFGEDLRTGVGLGLRYRAPVGMIRIDLAHPLDGDQAVRLHLSLGPDL